MWALLPIKSFAEAKQRLAGALTPDERAGLPEAMAQDVLRAMGGCRALQRIVVISRDPAARALAGSHGVEFLVEPPQAGGLNASVKHAVEQFGVRGAEAIMIVHGDLPMLASEDLQRVVEAHSAPGRSAVTLVPDRALAGTNVLAWSPLDGFRAQYGESSFQRHREQAMRRGAALSVCESAAAGLDIDLPGDLVTLIRTVRADRAQATRQYLERSGIARRLSAAGERILRSAVSMDGG